MRQCIKMGLGFMPLLLAVVVLFQNCSEQPISNSELSSQAFKSAPFAFDANVDTMAYMSCSNMSTYDPRAFFTFKMGSYTPSTGISITPEFLNAMKYYSTSERRAALEQSTANSGAWLQMSLRQKNNYQNILANGGAEPDKEYFSFLQNLDSAPVANVLLGLSSGSKARYFNGISEASYRNFEGAIRFVDGDEGIAESIRSQTTSLAAILALTYTKTADSDDVDARSPASTGNKAYGMGYTLTYGYPAGFTSALPRVMSTVREMNLATGATSSANTTGALRDWSCPASLNFMIVRRQDVIAAQNANQPTPCDLTSMDDNSTQLNRDIISVVRRVLPVDYYHLDLNKKCIVAKEPMSNYSCYGPRANNAPAIAYSGSTTCDASNCPHYLSVCIRP